MLRSCINCCIFTLEPYNCSMLKLKQIKNLFFLRIYRVKSVCVNVELFKLFSCQTVDFTSVDTRNSEREAATFNRMHEITSSYQRSTIYQSMLGKMEQSLQKSDKPAIPFKSKESPSGAAKLEVLLRSVLNQSITD